MRAAPLLGLILALAGRGTAAHEPPVSVCHNYGCKARYQIVLMPRDWARLRAIFEPPARDAAAERRRVQRAVGAMERIVAFYSDTGEDRGRDNNGEEQPGRMDCIDEARNTDTYLHLFAAHGWLHFHDVGPRTLRHPWIVDDHWTAVLVERATGVRYAVDSWYYDNGVEPVIQRLDRWMHKYPFTPPPGER